MKIRLIVVALLAITFGVVQGASDVPDPLKQRLTKDEFQQLPPDQRRAYLERLSYVNNGGHVIKTGTGKGIVRVIISSDKFDPEILTRSLSAVEKLMRVKIDVAKGASATVENAREQMTLTKSEVAVFVVDKPGLPRLLSAPEEGWAIVNIAALEEGNPRRELFTKRIIKEVMRATSLAMGCSNVGGCMQPVTDIRSLDFLAAETYPLNARPQIYKTLEEFGVEPRTEASYKVACQQGWAPAPTNEIQKAIWDKIHAIPDKPITIEYDPKKDK